MRLRMLILLVLPLMAGGAGDAELDRATLKGLNSFGVVIDRLDPALEQNGITRDVLQSRLSDRFERAGLKVSNGTPEFVGLRITEVRGGRGPYAASLTIGFYQPVLLVRDHNIKTATQTWEVETILLAEPKQLFRASMNSVDELADRFVAAYRSVNPK